MTRRFSMNATTGLAVLSSTILGVLSYVFQIRSVLLAPGASDNFEEAMFWADGATFYNNLSFGGHCNGTSYNLFSLPNDLSVDCLTAAPGGLPSCVPLVSDLNSDCVAPFNAMQTARSRCADASLNYFGISSEAGASAVAWAQAVLAAGLLIFAFVQLVKACEKRRDVGDEPLLQPAGSATSFGPS